MVARGTSSGTRASLTPSMSPTRFFVLAKVHLSFPTSNRWTVTGALFKFRAATRARLLPGTLDGVYFAAAVKIADQWEKAIVLRPGPGIARSP